MVAGGAMISIAGPIALAASLSAGQGSALWFEIPDEPGLVAVEATWRDTSIPLARDDNWFAVLGVDLDDATGPNTVENRDDP